jgi:putative (di)nucleoside polyphosphate hydrolase
MHRLYYINYDSILFMPTKFFRAGVACVIYKDEHTIGLFKRAVPPIGLFELPQGGIDSGESPEVALWRELKEEIGCNMTDFVSIHRMPHWTVYQGTESVPDDNNGDRLGQAHAWFFLKLAPEIEIDLRNATEPEVSEYKWVTFTEVIDSAPEYKKHVYETLGIYFKTNYTSI